MNDSSCSLLCEAYRPAAYNEIILCQILRLVDRPTLDRMASPAGLDGALNVCQHSQIWEAIFGLEIRDRGLGDL
jgi:hypothetical protein